VPCAISTALNHCQVCIHSHCSGHNLNASESHAAISRCPQPLSLPRAILTRTKMRASILIAYAQAECVHATHTHTHTHARTASCSLTLCQIHLRCQIHSRCQVHLRCQIHSRCQIHLRCQISPAALLRALQHNESLSRPVCSSDRAMHCLRIMTKAFTMKGSTDTHKGDTMKGGMVIHKGKIQWRYGHS
jgi:hypothetical protein